MRESGALLEELKIVLGRHCTLPAAFVETLPPEGLGNRGRLTPPGPGRAGTIWVWAVTWVWGWVTAQIDPVPTNKSPTSLHPAGGLNWFIVGEAITVDWTGR